MAGFGGGFLGGAVGGAFVELLLDDSPFSAGLTSAEAKLKGFSGKAGSSLTGFSKVSQVAFAASAAAAAAFVVKSVQAYNEHQVAMTALQNAISKMPKLVGASAQAFDEQAKAIALATGADRDQIIAADEVLTRYNLTEKQIRDLIPLVVDYATKTGVSVPVAAGNLGRALLGNARALKAIGINFKATGDITKDYNAILTALKSKVDGAAEAFGSTNQGKIQRFGQALKDIEISFGQGLQPVINAALAALRQLLPVVEFGAHNFGLLLAAFLGFKAVGFLPVLLQAVAKGLFAIGAELTGVRLSIFADGLAGIAAAAGPMAAAVVIGTLAVQKLKPSFDAATKTIEKFGSGSKEGAAAAGVLGAALGRGGAAAVLIADDVNKTITPLYASTAAAFSNANAYEHMVQPIRDAAKALNADTDSIHRNVDAMLAQRALADALAGGILGLVSSAKQAHDANVSLSQAQKKVNADIAKGRTGTKQYAADLAALHDAQFAALQGQLQFHAALTQYAQQLRGPVDKAQKQVTKDLVDMTKGGKTAAAAHARLAADTAALTAAQHGLAPAQQHAIALLESMGRKAGLTKKQVDTLIAGVLGLAGSIDGLHDKDVNIGVHYNYTYQYGQRQPGGGKGPQAHGGIFRGFAGGATFMDRSGPFQAGEGGYYTPLGTGMEMVGSRGVAPLTPDVFRSIGQALGKYLLPHLNGGGGVHIHGDVYGYDDFCRKVRQANYSTMRGRVR